MSYRRVFFISSILSSLACACALQAAPFTWVGGMPDNELLNANNWSPMSVPGNMDVATFGNTPNTNLTLAGDFEINAFNFNAGTSYTLTPDPNLSVRFINTVANPDSGVIATIAPQTFNFLNPIQNLLFEDDTSADRANSGLVAYNLSGDRTSVIFMDDSNAGRATINVANLAAVFFRDFSTAASAEINSNQGRILFSNASTANNTVINAVNTSDFRFSDNASGGTSTANLSTSTLIFELNSRADQMNIMASQVSKIDFTNAAAGDLAAVNLLTGSILNLFGQDITLTSVNGDPSAVVALNQFNLALVNFGTSTFDGVIQDGGMNGSLTLADGTLRLNGINTYTGLTLIQNGDFTLNGQIAGDAVVQNGRIFGTGTILGSLSINSGALIHPGNSIGTLHVGGNYVQDAGSAFAVEFNGLGQADLIDIGGTATLNGGQVIAVPLDLTPSPNPYLILHADGGVNGTFEGVVFFIPLPGLTPSLAYDANNVYLIITGGGGGGGFSFPAATCNQKAVAAVLEGIVNPTANQLLVLQTLQNLQPLDAQHALNQISGEQYTTLLATAEVTSQQFMRRLYDPLRAIVTSIPCRCCCYCEPDTRVWLEASGGQTFLDGNVNCRGLKMNGYEFSGGVQSTVNCDWTLGLAGTYAHDHAQYRVGGTGDQRTTLAALYALYRPQGYYILGDVAVGTTFAKVKRPIHIGGLTYKAKSHPEVYQGLAYGEVGLDFSLGCFLVQPFGGLEASVYRRSHIDEQGAGWLNLSIDRKTKTNCHTRLGVHLSTANLSCFTVSLDVAWQYRLTNPNSNLHQHFEHLDDTFKIFGHPLGRNSVDGALTLTTTLKDRWQLYLQASGQKWPHAASYDVLAGVNYNW